MAPFRHGATAIESKMLAAMDLMASFGRSWSAGTSRTTSAFSGTALRAVR